MEEKKHKRNDLQFTYSLHFYHGVVFLLHYFFHFQPTKHLENFFTDFVKWWAIKIARTTYWGLCLWALGFSLCMICSNHNRESQFSTLTMCSRIGATNRRNGGSSRDNKLVILALMVCGFRLSQYKIVEIQPNQKRK